MAPPPPEPSLEQKLHMTSSYHAFVHNTSVAMLFVAPALIALPPRKLDFYTFTLAGIFAVSGNQLLRERNGVGILGVLPGRKAGRGVVGIVPEHGQEQGQGRILEERKEEAVRNVMRKGAQVHGEMVGRRKEEDWKERRLKEEQEKLDQGEGYGSMIMDQIWDVWNWGEKKAEGLQEKDKQVLKERARVKKEERKNREFPVIGKS